PSPALEAPPAPRVALQALPAGVLAEPVEAVILRRGSSRRFPRAPIPLDALATVIACAARPAPITPYVQPELYVIANAVDGLEPGAYAAAADGRSLELLRSGDLRRDAGHLDLDQPLAADAAANLYWLVDLERVFARLGGRGYRAAQLAAAVAGGRAYLAAYALGLGATGLTFYDDAVTAFLSPHAAGKAVMFLVAIGRRLIRRPATS
ncbi:MAG TPA: nitroreductase family protein, partial [Candidatus Limnocylindria bacterium]|nr:nitroreductase family protein [Candidatus Limnocylindria bacterium]